MIRPRRMYKVIWVNADNEYESIADTLDNLEDGEVKFRHHYIPKPTPAQLKEIYYNRDCDTVEFKGPDGNIQLIEFHITTDKRHIEKHPNITHDGSTGV